MVIGYIIAGMIIGPYTPPFSLISTIGSVLAFIGGVLFIGSKTVPKLVNLIGKANQHDVLVVAILGVAFVIVSSV